MVQRRSANVSPGKQEIMIFIDNVPPLLYAAFLENPGQNISYTYLHGNCIFKRIYVVAKKF